MTEWYQVLAMILGNAGIIIPLFLWNRSESRSDYRHMDSKLESTRELVRAIYEESKNFQLAMMQESKDFHGRLCAIEERNKEKK